MKRAVAIVVGVVLLAVSAEAAEAIELQPKQRQTLTAAGATAAYALDSGIADVVLHDGVATIAALAAGSTQIVIVTPSGLQYVPVIVRASQQQLSVFRTPQLAAANGTFETQYDSFTHRLQNIVGYYTQRGARVTSVYLNDTVLRSPSAPSRHIVPAASIRIFTPRRELVLLDDTVRLSPLTLEGAIVRGIHLRDHGLQIHAGYSSFSLFDNLLFSRSRAAVVGISDAFRLSPRASLIPAIYVFPTRNAARGTAGTVASLGYDYDAGAPLRIRSEVGVSRNFRHDVLPGGSFELSRFTGPETQSLRIQYQPDGFASLDTAVHGFRSDGLWIRELSPKWRSTTMVSANRFSIAGFRQTNAIGEEMLRYAVHKPWFLTAGARDSYLSAGNLATAIQTREIPAGFEYASAHFGFGSTYSYIWSNGSDRGGHGIQLFARAQTDSTMASLYALRRTQTPTLEFVFDQIPGLELALRQFGVTASTPQDLVRLLRDYPDLANAGVIRGINLNISPVHYQAGASFSSRARGGRERRLDISMNYARDELVAHTRESGIASATYAFRVTPSLELATQYSRFFSRQDSASWLRLSGWNVALRYRFNDLPAPATMFARRGDIRGVVFFDPEGDGEYAASDRGIQGVEVWLDGQTKTTTTRDGRFVFSGIRSGAHRVEARYAAAKPFRYTTSPVVQTDIGEPLAIGIGPVAGHLTAIIRTTEGRPLDHVQVSVEDGKRVIMGESSGGKSSIDLPRAETVQVAVNTDSLPPGYLVVDGGPKALAIQEGHPATVEFVLQPMRSISGTVTVAHAGGRGVRVTLDGSKTTVTDSDGNYVFRDVSSGSHTIACAYRSQRLTRTVVVPIEPAAVHDVNFDFQGSGAPTAPALTGSSFVVQVGAYRQPKNAEDAIHQVRSAGLEVSVIHHGELTIVRAGPFASRAEADAARARLSRLGIDAITLPEHR